MRVACRWGRFPCGSPTTIPATWGGRAASTRRRDRFCGPSPGWNWWRWSITGRTLSAAGGGSNLETYDPELMRKVAYRRLGQALETGAEAIVTACTQCERTLRDAARRERAKVRVMDITEIVWRAAKAAGQDRKGGDGEGLI